MFLWLCAFIALCSLGLFDAHLLSALKPHHVLEHVYVEERAAGYQSHVYGIEYVALAAYVQLWNEVEVIAIENDEETYRHNELLQQCAPVDTFIGIDSEQRVAKNYHPSNDVVDDFARVAFCIFYNLAPCFLCNLFSFFAEK